MLVQIRPIYGFIIGGLLASLYPILLLTLSPFVLLVTLLIRSAGLTLGLMFVLGVVWVNAHWIVAEDRALPESAGRIEQLLIGEVERVVRHKNKVEFDFTSSDYGRLKVSCFYCPLTFHNDEQWQLLLRIKPIHSFSNPSGFDYRQWLIAKGYAARAYTVNQSDHNRLIRAGEKSAVQSFSVLFESGSLPFIQALVLGDKSNISVENRRIINQLGISHLFVVSGLHIGMVATLFALLVYWLQRPLLIFHWHHAKLVAVMSGVCGALFYGYVTGFQVPAIRAVIMLVFAAYFLLAMRHVSPVFYLVWVMVLVIFLQPLAFMDMGSWLSFSIVLALVLGFSGIQHRSWWLTLFKAQALAFCMGSLVLIGFSQAIVPASFLVNLVLIPIFSLLIMPAIVIGLLLATMGENSFLNFVEYGIEYLFSVLDVANDSLNWWLPIHVANELLVGVGLLILLLCASFRGRLFGGLVFLVSLFIPLKNSDHGGFKLTVFDVGQGSAALIETQHKRLLVDTGAQFSSGLTLVDLVIQPYFKRHDIRSLDMLHLTHSDNDHAGGKHLIEPITKTVIHQAKCQPAQWYWDGVLFERFQAVSFQSGNNGSCLLRVTSSAGESVLFTGDIEKEAEAELVERMPWLLNASVLISPHHGSRTSSSSEFLEVVNAEFVIISAGFLNRYHHPHEQTLDKYQQRNMKVYATHENGAIQVRFPARQVALVVSTYRP